MAESPKERREENETYKLLLKQMDKVNDKEETVLHKAVNDKNILFIRSLLKQKPDLLFKQDINGNTPLHLMMSKDYTYDEIFDGDRLLLNFLNKNPDLLTMQNNVGDTVVHCLMTRDLQVLNDFLIISVLLIINPRATFIVNDNNQTPERVKTEIPATFPLVFTNARKQLSKQNLFVKSARSGVPKDEQQPKQEATKKADGASTDDDSKETKPTRDCCTLL